jgi:guanine deaminase
MLATDTFHAAIPGLLEALPAAARRDLESLRLAPGDASLAACRRLIEGWGFDRARIKPALAPTIPLHCSDELMRASRSLASELEVGLHMHLAESKVQAIAGLRRYGKTLTAHLDAIGFLGPDFTAAHGVWLDGEDIRRLADNGCSVAHNPGSNARLGSGIAAVRELRDAGVNVGVGTDGSNCSDNQNMFEAMRFAAYVSRLRSHDYERWLGSAEVLRLATEGSARALGYEGELGRIEPGYRADITFLDRGHVNFLAANDVANQLVNVEDGGSVDGVMVDGEMVLWHGRFTRVDVQRVRREVEQAVEELRGIGANARRFAEMLEPHVGRFCIGLARTPYHVHALAGSDY